MFYMWSIPTVRRFMSPPCVCKVWWGAAEMSDGYSSSSMIPLWYFADLICTENSVCVFVCSVCRFSVARVFQRSGVFLWEDGWWAVTYSVCYLLFLSLRGVKNHSPQYSGGGPIPQNSISFSLKSIKTELEERACMVWHGISLMGMEVRLVY